MNLFDNDVKHTIKELFELLLELDQENTRLYLASANVNLHALKQDANAAYRMIIQKNNTTDLSKLAPSIKSFQMHLETFVICNKFDEQNQG